MKTNLFVAVVVVLTSTVFSLECFDCVDCQPNLIHDLTGIHVETCVPTLFTTPVCIKDFNHLGTVNRRCGTRLDCAVELLNKCDEEEDTLCRTCCYSDRCNGTKYSSRASILVIAVVGIFNKFLI